MVKKIVALFSIVVFLFSCNKDDNRSDNELSEIDKIEYNEGKYSEDSVKDFLKFVDVSSYIDDRGVSAYYLDNGYERFADDGGHSLIIVKWKEWGRAAKNCAGWGLCYADWFPQFKKQKIVIPSLPKPVIPTAPSDPFSITGNKLLSSNKFDRVSPRLVPVSENEEYNSGSSGASSLLEYDFSKEKYYIDILLAEYPPKDMSLKLLTLRIDADFVLDLKNEISRDLVFKSGKYEYNKNLGLFGGYRVYLDEK